MIGLHTVNKDPVHQVTLKEKDNLPLSPDLKTLILLLMVLGDLDQEPTSKITKRVLEITGTITRTIKEEPNK